MFWPLVIVVVLFHFSLLVRNFYPNICALCTAVSLGWIIGLVVGFDPLALALLMGGSAVGFMYYLVSKYSRWVEFFKLPLLLTTFSVFYFVSKPGIDIRALGLIAGLWVIFVIIYLLRNKGSQGWFRKVVECCKNW